jgi:glycine hydroxymethyltransferase
MHAVTAKAVAFGEALQPEFADYARAVVDNAGTLAGLLSEEGLRIVSGGTDNHLFLIDLKSFSMTGAEAQETLKSGGIVCNKNAIPFDAQSLGVTRGNRLGTPAVTSRGMKAEDMETIAGFIVEALHAKNDATALRRIRARVTEFASGFPVPGLDDRQGFIID